ncbi:MAG: hypothetical protein HY960_14570 [Ignavibacteriae bacterium]|nr:hypothetical protein [Ignavibacteriota bacterium]
MAKETEHDQSNFEKLRDELFEVRVDIKAYIRSLKILGSSVAILFTILAYFGYDKIDSVQQTILNKANQRLAQTDSLLANIDQTKLDSLNRLLVQKQKEYQITLSNFELALRRNKELEFKLFDALKPNERTEYEIPSWTVHPPEDFFEVKYLPDKYRSGEKLDLYLSFSESFNLNDVKVLRVELTEYREGQAYRIRDYKFKVQQRLNKFSITLDIPKGKYLLEVGFVKMEGNGHGFYRLQKSIEIV